MANIIKATTTIASFAILLGGFSSVPAYAATGASTGTGYSTSSRIEACDSAKRRASNMKPGGARITGYTSCDCSNDGDRDSPKWNCSVDAYWTKD